MARLRARTTSKRRPARERGAPAKILAKLRSICLTLPGAYEEVAWAGTRWLIRKRNFAHIVQIEDGWPPAYARAASSDGPLLVVTVRTSPELHDVLRDAAPRFFHAPWGTRWGTQVLGIKLEGKVDWPELELLITESYRLLAPKPRRAP